MLSFYGKIRKVLYNQFFSFTKVAIRVTMYLIMGFYTLFVCLQKEKCSVPPIA